MKSLGLNFLISEALERGRQKAIHMSYYPNKIKLHLGTHKTATTHLQNTLSALKDEMEREGIHYLPRREFRDVFRSFTHNNGASTFLPIPYLKRKKIVDKLILKPCEVLLASEENILGDCSDLCDIVPYGRVDLDFINTLSEVSETTVYLCLRSFDKVYPGAYITALRFRPRAAIVHKNKLIKNLENGQLPSWFSFIQRLQSWLPKVEIKLWEYESYSRDSNAIIRALTGAKLPNIPKVPPPPGTKTPNFKAVDIAEKKAMADSFKLTSDWTGNCDAIYRDNPAESGEQKYTFIKDSWAENLQAQYAKDIRKIQSTWPQMLMKV